MTTPSRLPPHDLETEKGVLGAMLLNGSASVDEVRAVLKPEDFYSEAHRRVAESCFDLAARGMPVDMIAVCGWLKDKERLQQVQVGYVAEIAEAAPVILREHVQRWALRVRAKARQRRLALKLREACERAYVVGEAELEAFFESVEREVTEECSDRQRKGFESLAQIMGPVMKQLDVAEKAQQDGRIPGVPTGFERFDRITGGFLDGDLIVVAARPGMGKTALVTGVLSGVAKFGFGGAMFSTEMPTLQIGNRALFSEAKVNLQKGRTGTLNQNDWSKLTQTAHELAKFPIYIDDTPGISLTEIRSKLRSLVGKLTRQGVRLGVAIVDYLQILDLQEERGETRDAAIGRMTRGLKKTAKELGIPIILLSQLNRDVERRDDKRPKIADLRESGSIENDADAVVFIYRDEYYHPDTVERGIAELIIAKQRNGPTGTVKVGFDKESTAFFNLRECEYEDEE